MKVICMIPCRQGSKRIPRKNLRILYDKPLLAWAIEAAKKANCFDEIWVNGDAETFCDLAQEYGVRFYKRSPELGSDEAANDDFMYDFLSNVECDKVVQVLATSPFISPTDISLFTDQLDDSNAVVSVKEVRIECIYDDAPINFDWYEKTQPSQSLQPVYAYACALMGYDAKTFMGKYEAGEGAYHGRDGSTSYYILGGYSTIDIDTEEDWQLAEIVAEKIALNKKNEPQYYEPGLVKGVEADVPSILQKDGVENNDLFDVNREIISIDDIFGVNAFVQSWSKRVIDSPSNSATIITQQKGEGNRLHLHYNWDEWWFILNGEWEFEIEGVKRTVKRDDIVFIQRGKKHKITALTNDASRLAVSRADVPHVYV